ncbi:MAG TPA: isocitrate/isopropylmalate family dehydrogenase [Candidatus Binatia bacterium]|nr:isocitrate/isopropylmalate family dehydrogenase [Candidatus Binatia bacterium]
MSERYKIALLPGDGIGPEVAAAARSVVDATGLDIEWLDCRAGAEEAERGGEALPESVLARIRSADAALKGPVGTPIGKGFQSVNVRLRRALDLYASLRPVKSLRGVESRFENVDLIIVRENTEGLYAGIEHVVVPGVVESLKVVTERACTRIAEFAFDYAGRHHRRKVTAAHKASVMAVADGLFLNCAQRVARRYPDIDYEERIIDDLSMNLVLDPGDFDVVFLENLYGDIVSDLAAGLVGGLGVVPGANIGDGIAVYEAVHGSAPDIAGRGVANADDALAAAAKPG